MSTESHQLWTRITEMRFVHAFVASFTVIILSEIGDKTFFLAAILAMRHSRLTVFSSTMLALFTMTLLSVGLGLAASAIPRWVTHYLSIALFLIFGIKMLIEGLRMSPMESKDQCDEIQMSLNNNNSIKNESMEDATTHCEQSEERPCLNGDIESSNSPDLIETNQEALKFSKRDSIKSTVASIPMSAKIRRRLMAFCSLIFLQTFAMTFVAEWGDRSQITTVILAARENPFGVAVGTIVGHSICTALAVIGGRLVAHWISVRTVTIIGGVVFIVFAFTALILNKYDLNG